MSKSRKRRLRAQLRARAKSSRNPATRSLRYEPLEDRRMLAVVTVDTDQDVVDFSDGLTSLREAIFATNLVEGADEIVFDFGHDGPATILLTEGELAITDSLTITGNGAELLTIDAQQNSRILNIDDPSSFFESFSVTLSGLTLANGRTFGDNLGFSDTTYNGAGIRFLSDGILTLEGITLSGSSTLGLRASGGGIASFDGIITLRNSTLLGNYTLGNSAHGGGIFTAAGDVKLINSTLSENSTVGDDADGGGISTLVGDVTLTNSILSRNSTAGKRAGGGGIVTFSGSLTINNSTLSENITGGSGGGIYATRGSVTLIGSTLSSNSTTGSGTGGGIFTAFANVKLISSTLSENSTTGRSTRGGGIITGFGNVTLIGSTLSGNSTAGDSAHGGGIYSLGSVTIINSTLTGNSTTGTSANNGGISMSNRGSNASLTIRHSIIAGNTVAIGNNGPNFIPDPANSLVVEYSLIGDNLGMGLPVARTADTNGNLVGSHTSPINPLLGPLSDNGGPTLTHALLPGSPAINAGDLSSVAGTNGVPRFDQRGAGFDRVLSRLDIGAYEVQELGDLNLLVDTLVDESDGDFSRGDLSLREAIELANANPVPDTIRFDEELAGGTILLTMGELAITNSVEIVGLGAELLTIDASGNNPTPDENNGDGSRIFNIEGPRSRGFDVVISGMTLTGGDVDGSGGAIFSREKTVLVDMTIEGNAATVDGGGVFDGIWELDISESTFSENIAGDRGGGIAAAAFISSLQLKDSHVSGNHALEGGGIYARSGPEILLSTISGNVATGSGGGLFTHATSSRSGQPLYIRDSTISENSSGHQGGGVYTGGETEIVLSQFTANRSTHDGGGVFTLGETKVSGSTFAENHSTSYSGGGVFASQTTLEIDDGTFSGNTAFRDGGGLFAIDTDATIRESIFRDNSATTLNGGGIWSRGNLNIADTTLFRNSANRGGGLYIRDSSTTITGSTLVANSATVGGGLFANDGGELGIFETAIIVNVASGENAEGGGLFLDDVRLTLASSNVGQNSVSSTNASERVVSRGGGISTHNGFATIIDSSISGNRTLGGLGDGGGLYSVDTAIEIRGSKILENFATRDGGGIFLVGGRVIIVDTLISNNLSDHDGGGIFRKGGMKLSDVEVKNNSAGHQGGGIFQTTGSLSFIGSSMSGNESRHDGGGVFLTKGGPSQIFESTFSNNHSVEYSGGGLFASRATVFVVASSFTNNTAHFDGGGLFAIDGNTTIRDSTFSDNSAETLDGGAIWAKGGTNIIGSMISGNSTGDDGGGIFSAGVSSRLTIADSTISGNSTRGGDAFSDGAGLFFRDGRVDIHDSLFADNTAVDRAGGARFLYAEATIERTTFRNNESLDDWGGAIHSSGSVVTIGDSTLHDNRALTGFGGAIHNEDFPDREAFMSIIGSTLSGNLARRAGAISNQFSGDLDISHSTITGNSGQSTALYSNSTLDIHHSIIAGNSSALDLFSRGGAITVEYSLIGSERTKFVEASIGSPDAHGNLIGGPVHGVIDPMLADLAENGGPTQTHALLPGSPAINAGDLNTIVGTNGVPLFDQRGEGFERIVSRIDIGAYEVQELGDLNLLVDTLVDESDSDFSRGDLSLREAIELANANPVPDTIRFDPIFAAIAGPLPATILLTEGELLITDSVEIVGLGAELLTIDASGNDPTPDIVDRLGSTVFRISKNTAAESQQFEISGLTLTGGDEFLGGAIVSDKDLTLSGVVIDSNAGFRGGGIYVSGGTLRLIESTISNNIAVDGGGIHLENGRVQANHSIISRNQASSGGGIRVSKGRILQVHSSTIRDNQATLGGGIFTSFTSELTITSSTINDNQASSNGGGVYGFGFREEIPFFQIAKTTIRGNLAKAESFGNFGGGGIFLSGAKLVLRDSLVTENHSNIVGGGIVSRYADTTLVTNSTISGNSAFGHGGGIFAQGDFQITHSTIANNLTDSNENDTGLGGGIYSRGRGSIDHTIIHGNQNGPLRLTDDFYARFGVNNQITSSIIGTINPSGPRKPSWTADLATRFGLDPLLGDLADNGGSTLTHALLPGSPAINAGDPLAVDIPNFDQRGNPFARISGGRIDIGAYEVQPLPGDFDGDGDSDGFDLAHWESDFGITENSASDSDSDGDTDGSDFLNWQRTFGVVQPTVENRSLAEEANESELRVTAVDLALAADEMLNGPQIGRATITALDDTLDFAIDLTLSSPQESPRPVQRAASRAAFELLEVTASDEDAPDELDEELSTLDEVFALL